MRGGAGQPIPVLNSGEEAEESAATADKAFGGPRKQAANVDEDIDAFLDPDSDDEEEGSRMDSPALSSEEDPFVAESSENNQSMTSRKRKRRLPKELKDFELRYEPEDGDDDDEESVILTDDEDDERKEERPTQEDTEMVDAMAQQEKEGEEEYMDDE